MKKQLSGICLFVSSTFGNGDPPRTGESLAQWIDEQLTKKLSQHVARLSVDFDAIGADQNYLHRRMNNVNANRKFIGNLRLV